MKITLLALVVAGLAAGQGRAGLTPKNEKQITLFAKTPSGMTTLMADRIEQSKDGKTIYLKGHVSITTLTRAPGGPTVISADEADLHMDGEIETRGTVTVVPFRR